MKTKIINWLKAEGTLYQEDYIEIIYTVKNDDCKLLYDILKDELCVIDYDSKGNILDVEILDTDKKLQKAIEIFCNISENPQLL